MKYSSSTYPSAARSSMFAPEGNERLLEYPSAPHPLLSRSRCRSRHQLAGPRVIDNDVRLSYGVGLIGSERDRSITTGKGDISELIARLGEARHRQILPGGIGDLGKEGQVHAGGLHCGICRVRTTRRSLRTVRIGGRGNGI